MTEDVYEYVALTVKLGERLLAVEQVGRQRPVRSGEMMQL
jgi:hypothetical protein